MALYPNGRYLTRSPGRHFGAAGVGLENKARGRSDALNRFVGLIPATSSTPGGYGAETPWLPIKPGGLSGGSAISTSASGSGAMGVNTQSSATIALDFTGTGGLISSASGTAGMMLGASAALYATKAVIGSGGIVIDASGAASAIGHLDAQTGIALSASWQPYALGWLSGSTADTGLTVTGISNAVWDALLAQHQVAGSAGLALSTASSGGVDYNALAAAILAAAQITPIHSDMRKINNTPVTGAGVPGNEWGAA